jgi:hypothetical protein
MGEHSFGQPAAIGRKVPATHGCAGEGTEHRPEKEIEDPEANRFTSPGSPCDTEPAAIIPHGDEWFDQTGQVFRPILPVRVHCDNEVRASYVWENEPQTIDKGSLMPEIERGSDDAYIEELLQAVNLNV